MERLAKVIEGEEVTREAMACFRIVIGRAHREIFDGMKILGGFTGGR